jgi:hypothetical protein
VVDERGSTPGPVRPVVALVLATVAFIALLIFGLGMVSLFSNADVIEAPGLGQIPGIAATTASVLAFAAALGANLRPAGTRSYAGALWTALACLLAYVAGLWITAVLLGADFAVATAAAGRIATTWFGAVIAGAGALAAWGGIALVRTRAERPRWPWEDEFDE